MGTYIEWSPSIENLFLTVYVTSDKNNELANTEGSILLWNVEMKTRPEFYCLSHSSITAACFHPFNSQLVLGGLATGQLAIWDVRAKHYPVAKSLINSDIHMFSINSMKVLGTRNAYHVATISLDGRLSDWNLAKMDEVLQGNNRIVFNKKDSKNEQIKAINPTCMTFPKGDVNNFYMGTELGSVMDCALYPSEVSGLRVSDDAKIFDNEHIKEVYEGHEAPVSSLSILQSNLHGLGTNGLLLSSSYDWTVKMFHPKRTNKALFTFDTAEDYVIDAQWNPDHPCMFVTGDCDGTIQLYDLLKDTDYPIEYIRDPKKSGVLQTKWNPDGHKLVTSTISGEIDLYSISKGVASSVFWLFIWLLDRGTGTQILK